MEKGKENDIKRSIEVAETRAAIAEYAFDLSLDELLTMRPDSSNLITHVFTTMRYSWEADSHNANAYRSRILLGDNTSKDDLEINEKALVELGLAIQFATQGDYSQLKRYAKEELPITIEGQYEGANLEGNEEYKSRIEKIEALINALPETGEALSLPLPAWMDPRFNQQSH